ALRLGQAAAWRNQARGHGERFLSATRRPTSQDRPEGARAAEGAAIGALAFAQATQLRGGRVSITPVREGAAYNPFKIFTNSPCTNSLPQTTWPVVSALSWPSMPETVPPASRTMIWPAAISQGCRLRSQ